MKIPNFEIAPVAIVFFNRPEKLQKVFNEVRKVRPSQLFLIQDGPRNDNSEDIEKIYECRRIVDEIDWECEVKKNYSDINLGCGIRPSTGFSWVFSEVDNAIFLEDDCVPSTSFFIFCSELLKRYSDDERIFMITGCNFDNEVEISDQSYFFGFSGTNWGWASWRRCWDQMDYKLDFVDDEFVFNMLADKLKLISGKKGLDEINLFKETNKDIKEGKNISYWDVQWQVVRYLNHQLSIIPSKNLISNIGTGEDSTHAKNVKEKLFKKQDKFSFFFNERYEMDFPLVHPKYVIQNVKYDKFMDTKIYPNKFVRFFNIILSFIKRLSID